MNVAILRKTMRIINTQEEAAPPSAVKFVSDTRVLVAREIADTGYIEMEFSELLSMLRRVRWGKNPFRNIMKALAVENDLPSERMHVAIFRDKNVRLVLRLSELYYERYTQIKTARERVSEVASWAQSFAVKCASCLRGA